MTEFVADLVADNGADFNSGSIDTVAYDREGKRLLVEFQSGGTYAYDGVEESTYNLLVTAPSLNHFWRNHISGEFTSTKDDFWVSDRPVDEDEPVDLVPTQKWLTESDKDNLVLNGDIGIFAGTLTVPVIHPARFGVRWTNGTLTFEPEFEALSEADALAQFNAAVTQVMPNADVKILAVTHYFD